MINLNKSFAYPRAVLIAFKLTKNASLNQEQIKKIQFRKLKKLLIYSYENISFYRERMDSVSFSPYTFSDISEYQKIPVLTKSEYKYFMQRELKEFPEKYKTGYKNVTSGSTGHPLKIYRTWEEKSYVLGKWLRAMRMNGYSFFHKTYSLPSPLRVSKRDSWIQLLGIGRRNTVAYTDTVDNMINGYLETEPDFFYSNKSQMVLMAQEIIKRGIKIKQPKYYAVTSETLDDNSKRVIQSVFGKSNMFEVYGAVEIGGILAYQLKGEEGLNFCHDTNFLELDDNGKINSEKGSCIITDLHIRSFPLIRYGLGDWIEMDTSTTRNVSKIKQIKGRENDWIYLPDDQKVRFHPFHIIIQKREQIAQYKVIQRRKDFLEIQYVLIENAKVPDNFEKELVQEFKSKIHPDVEYIFKEKDVILPDPNGKLKMLVSKLEN